MSDLGFAVLNLIVAGLFGVIAIANDGALLMSLPSLLGAGFFYYLHRRSIDNEV